MVKRYNVPAMSVAAIFVLALLGVSDDPVPFLKGSTPQLKSKEGIPC
jgi:hypothetical protein